MTGTDRSVNVITQNVDDLHARAGTKNLIQLHGSLFKTRCTKCERVEVNHDNPIVPCLANVVVDAQVKDRSSQPPIQVDQLPQCSFCSRSRGRSGSLLRPHIVWFTEPLEVDVLKDTTRLLKLCDLLLVVS